MCARFQRRVASVNSALMWSLRRLTWHDGVMHVRFVQSAFAASCLCMALGGCNQTSAPDSNSPTTSSAAPAASPQTSAAQSPNTTASPTSAAPTAEDSADGAVTDDERAAVQAYRGFYELMPKVYATPGEAKNILNKVAGEPLLSTTQSAAWRNASRGWRVQGVPALTPFIAKRQPGTLVIHDCQDHDSVRTVSAESGKLVFAGKPATPVQAEVRKVDGQWFVVNLNEAPLSANICP